MKSNTNQMIGLAVSIVVFLVFVAVPVFGSEKGVTENSVKVGASLDMTGPIAFVGKVVSDGMNVYFSSVNDEGGIHGRKITQVIEDHAYNPSRAAASVAKLNNRDKVFAIVGGAGTATTMAMIPALERAELPLVGIGAFSRKLAYPPKKAVFQLLTIYEDQMRIGVDYIVKDLGVKKPKIGMIYQDDDFGKDCLDGLKRQAKMYGIPVIATVSYKRGSVDFNSQVVRMMKAGVEYCFLATVYRETAGVTKTAAKLGWKPTFIVSAAAADRITLKLSGPAADGLLGVACGELPDSQRPGWKKYLERTKKYGKAKPGFYHSVGYLFAEVFCEGLRLTGQDLTREKFINAMEGIKEFNTGVGPNITFGPNLRAGAHSAFVAKANAKKGLFEVLTDWRKPRDKP
ncbi:MAG: ABC transporter substrate-binding protein [Deltaproteobacteria bacterium]|nr:ABC transporter substrate-binding protein [Deltaproteobacteria bacterium]